MGLVNVVKNKKNQVRSTNRLEEKLAQRMVTINTPVHISALAKTRSGLAGSTKANQKEYADRLNRDPAYFSQILRTLLPVPYKYVQPFSYIIFR